MSPLRRFRGYVSRHIFLRGSPAYRVGVWITGIAGGLFLIFLEERRRPVKDRVLFLPSRREIPMEGEEIEEWNRRLSGGKLLSTPKPSDAAQPPPLEGIEERRARVKAAIEEEETSSHQETKRLRAGWMDYLLGVSDKAQNSERQKKVSLFFDK